MLLNVVIIDFAYLMALEDKNMNKNENQLKIFIHGLRENFISRTIRDKIYFFILMFVY